ncbi:MAG: rod-binding protein [Pseudomonadota bacterium]
MIPTLSTEQPAPLPTPQDTALRQAAQKLEATFLAEMLKSAGLGESPDTFGGGSGEDQFASFLVQAQAEEMVKAGGIGLAESIYESLKERSNDQ